MAARKLEGSPAKARRDQRHRQSPATKKRRGGKSSDEGAQRPETYPGYVMDSLVGGVALNAITIHQWSTWSNGGREFHLWPLIQSLQAAVSRSSDGDLSGAEQMLMAQVVSLNSLFSALAASAKETKYFDQLDRYMRLALKAQNQCRATVETLAVMKNPRIFASQANFAAGPQQINNRIEVARAENPVPNKLLEDRDERLDIGTSSEAISCGSPVEALEPLDRSKNSEGQRPRRAQRVPRRLAPAAP